MLLSYSFCNSEPHVIFQNPGTTPSGIMFTTEERNKIYSDHYALPAVFKGSPHFAQKNISQYDKVQAQVHIQKEHKPLFVC